MELSLFERLIMTKELTFTHDSIVLFGTRMLMVNHRLFATYIEHINDSPEDVYALYEAAKRSFMEGTGISLRRNFSFNFNNYVKWLPELAGLVGWGEIRWEIQDKEKRSGSVFLENSPITEELRGKVKFPVDHVVRGLIAGGNAIAFDEDIDA